MKQYTRTLKIVQDPPRKTWWVVEKDGWFVDQFKTPREARHFKRQWHRYMTDERIDAFIHLDVPCPSK